MSKKKKTIEKLLGEALVSEEEQPYEIPENWVWVKLDSSKKDGESFGDGDWILSENIDPNGEVRLVQLSDIGQGKFLNKSSRYISMKTFEELGCREIFPGDILISRMAHPIARSCIVPDLKQKLITAVDIAYLRPNEKIFDTKYLNYMFNSIFFRTEAERVARGTTRLRITRKNLGNLAIPFPPLNEQKRIAEKVERLLGKIEEAKQLIVEAKETFEFRRAAILDKAFRGELTRKWRDENNSEDILEYITSLKTITNLKGNGDILEPYDLPSGWRWARIGDLFHVQVGSTPSRKNADYWEGSLPWLSSGEVQFNTINESREQVTDLAVKECRLKLAPKGSILFGMIGEGKTRGQVALLNLDAYHNQNIASIWVSNTKVNSLYVYYWLVSQYNKNRQNSAGNNQPAYNKSRVQDLLIPIAPIAEIKVIVNQLQRLLELETNINNLLSLEETISAIRKSILSKAFQGELGTNDPSEVNAIELLKEVLQEQVK